MGTINRDKAAHLIFTKGAKGFCQIVDIHYGFEIKTDFIPGNTGVAAADIITEKLNLHCLLLISGLYLVSVELLKPVCFLYYTPDVCAVVEKS